MVTDPEINTEEYNELIDRAQEIVEETPEGDIPFDESYIGQYLQLCPICGTTFAEDHILEPGASCPICFEQPESFVVLGQVALEDTVAENNGVSDTESDLNDETANAMNTDDVSEEPTLKGEDSVSIEDLDNMQSVNASKEITPTGNLLTESETEATANENKDRYTIYIFDNDVDVDDDDGDPLCTIYDNKKDGFYFDDAGWNPVFDSEEEAQKYIDNNKLNS